MTTRSRSALASLIVATLLVLAAHRSDARSALFHTHLVKSTPAANDTLAASPAAIKLWFSEKVELAVTRVKLANATGADMTVAPVARPDTAKDAPVVAAIAKPLPPGGYVVSWSTAADDGHPAKGTIAFVVAGR